MLTKQKQKIQLNITNKLENYLINGEEILAFLIKREKYKYLLEKYKKIYLTFDIAHNWQHIDFVIKLALAIGEEKKADLDIIFLSALLHDLARKEELEGKCKKHEEESAIKAEKIIKDLELPAKQKDNIVHAIREHTSSTGSPKTLEAKIIADCDRIYSIITNPQRCILYGKEIDNSMEECMNYLAKKLKE